MTNFDYAKKVAERMARIDFKEGLHSDPYRYNALEKSAWARWYSDEYALQVELSSQKENNPPKEKDD
jgi:hypothetical protein